MDRVQETNFENDSLEDEMRKRRDRVKAWQQAKKKQNEIETVVNNTSKLT